MTDPFTSVIKPHAVVVDDDHDIRELLESILRSAGFEVILTEAAEDGLAAVQHFEPALTLIDVSMPGIDGFTAAQMIRQMSDTCLIIVSGRTDEIDVVQGLAAGANDYLFKPFRVRELRARIEANLRRAGGRPVPPQDAVADPHPPPSPDPEPTPAPSEPATAARVWRRPAPVDRLSDTRAAHAGAVARRRWSSAVATAEDDRPGSMNGVAVSQIDDVQRHPEEQPPVLVLGDLRLDRASGAASINGRGLDLSEPEFALLGTLMSYGRRVRSTSSLVLAMRGEKYVTSWLVTAADRGEVTAHVQSLRRKLGDSEASQTWIETVRDVGYRMAAR